MFHKSPLAPVEKVHKQPTPGSFYPGKEGATFPADFYSARPIVATRLESFGCPTPWVETHGYHRAAAPRLLKTRRTRRTRRRGGGAAGGRRKERGPPGGGR